MSEILRTGLMVGPAVGTAVGAAVGMAAGAIANRRAERAIAEDRQALSESMGEAADNAAVIHTKFKRVVRSGLSMLAMSGALAGAINGYAWSEADKAPAPPASVRALIDRSGATAFPGETEVAPREAIDSAVRQLKEQDNFNVTAHVARSGSVQVADIESVASISPFGEAPMQEGFDGAVGQIQLASPESEEGADNPAVVVVTNGNGIGKPKSVIAKAKEAETPVYVVNVNNDIDNATEEGLKRIAERTDGRYWDSSEVDVDEIPSEVSSEVSPVADQVGGDPKLPLKIIGAVGMLYFAGRIRTRRNEPINRGGNNIQEGDL